MLSARVGLLFAALLAGRTVSAMVFTVGAPGATHPDIQSALNAALAVAGDDEIRIASGTYAESLLIMQSALGGSLVVSGRWDPTFTARGPLPTIVDPSTAGGGRGFSIRYEFGQLTLDGLAFENGLADNGGGGMRMDLGIDAQGSLIECRFFGNRDAPPPGLSRRASGGGLSARITGDAILEVLDSQFIENVADAITDSARGGAVHIEASGNARFRFARNGLMMNRANSGQSFADGGAAWIEVRDSADGDMVDTLIDASRTSGALTPLATAMHTRNFGSGVLVLERLRVRNSQDLSGAGLLAAQLDVEAAGNGGVTRLRDSLVANGDGRGVNVLLATGHTIHLTNLTVANHPGTGIELPGGIVAAVSTLFNSIAFGNMPEANIHPGVGVGNNLIGTNPAFVDPTVGDYRVLAGSVAIDVGDNAPPGGLGAGDANGMLRIVNGIVDIGAYEFVLPDPIFGNGFE